MLRFIKALITQDGDIYKFRKTHPKTEGVVAEILKQSRHMGIKNQALFYAFIHGQIKTQRCQKLSYLEVELNQAGQK